MFDDLQPPLGRGHLLQLLVETISEVDQHLSSEKSGFEFGGVFVDLSFDQRERTDDAMGTHRNGGVIIEDMTSLGFDGNGLTLLFPSLRARTDRRTSRRGDLRRETLRRGN
jgi:hypothetical protein